MGDTFTITKTLARRLDFSDVTSPIVRWDELLPNAVVSGGIATVGASLTRTITALVALVNGRRVTVDVVAHAFTATKETYVDVGYSEDSDGVITGVLAYSEITIGNAEPSLASGYVRLMYVITNANSVTKVWDMRALNQGFGMGARVGV